MQTISVQRQGELALMYLKYKIRQDGVNTLRPNEIRRRIHGAAKAIGITIPEVEAFVQGLLQDALDECFLAPGKDESSVGDGHEG